MGALFLALYVVTEDKPRVMETHRSITTRSMTKCTSLPAVPSNSNAAVGTSSSRKQQRIVRSPSNPRGYNKGGDRDAVRISKPREREHVDKLPADLPTQCASYALEMMSNSGPRHHVIAASIIDAEITFQYYSHSVILYSEPLNFVIDFPRFLSVLLLLLSLKWEDWGFVTALPPPKFNVPYEAPYKPSLSLFHGQSICLGGQSYTLANIIYQQHSIIGRGTCVIEAKSDQDVDVVAKFSWLPSGRMPEDQFLRLAWSHVNNDSLDMADHLPRVLYHEVNDYWKRPDDTYEQRSLQIIVFDKLFPISQLTEAKDFAAAMRGIFRCTRSSLPPNRKLLIGISGYRWLHETPRILHRDISYNNLMYRIVGNEIRGVLNDFDLSYQMTDESPSPNNPTSHQRTGTLPFMAVDLLGDEPPLQGYRHDLESFFWVILLHISQHQATEVGKSRLNFDWLFGDRVQNQLVKLKIIQGKLTPDILPAFKPLQPWITNLQKMFLQGIFKVGMQSICSEPDFDLESSGGCITFEIFENIIMADLVY